ncbi:MAG: S46 family peptidase, partial [Deltaproteobacteria bacterium]|nr:S46 family peptidase [Deltaproteobacteria bacterium]
MLGSERDLLAMMLEEAAALPEDQRIPSLDVWIAAQGGADTALDRLFDDPSLASTEARLALLEADRTTLEASDDPWMTLAVQLEPWLAERRDED